MRQAFLVLLVVVAVTALPATGPILNYHEAIGIKEAARIRQAEEAADFDGARIINGSPTALGAHPYMGGIDISLQGNRKSVCGSSLLSNTRAVTAAHCWFDGWSQATQFIVVLGSILLYSGGVRITTNQVVMHPNWNTANVQNDIAIIRLSWVSFTNNIQPISLPSGSLLNNQFVGTWATANGFGITASNMAQSSNILLSVNLQVISNAVCHNTYPGFIFDSTLCTSGANGNICSGDSGGPLSIISGGQRVLIGVVSFGSGRGCGAGDSSAYARVTSFASWIRSQL